MRGETERKAADGARQLGLVTATSLVIANMIGTGVFTTSGFALADLGSPQLVLLAWLAGGLVATCGALSYGALARRIPESGGEYLFLSRTLHPAAGYIAGWISLLVGFSAPLAAAAFGFGEYTKSWLPGWPPQATGSVLLVGFCALHALFRTGGTRVQNLAVLLKVALIVAFVCFGLSRLPAPAAQAAPRHFPTGAFAVSLVWISFSYSGWNAAVYIGGEIRDPRRNLPRSLLLGTGLVTLLYLALNAVFLFSAHPSELSGKLEIGRIAAHALGGPAWAEAVTGLIALALATSVSSMMMAGPRVYARMAEDGCLPRWLATKSDTPRPALLLQCAVALAMLWSATYDRLLTYIGFTLGLSAAATVVGLVVLRRREGPSLAVPGWPWVPGLFLLAVLWMTVFAVAHRPAESMVGLATIGLGWAAWGLNRWRNGRGR